MDAEGVLGIAISLAIFAALGAVVVVVFVVRARTARREGARITARLRAAGVTPLDGAPSPRRLLPESASSIAFRDEAVYRGRRLVTELAHATRFTPRKTYFSLQVAAPTHDEGRLFVVSVGRTVIPWLSIVHGSRRDEMKSPEPPQGTADAAFDAAFDVWAAVDLTSSRVVRMKGTLRLAEPVRSALLAAGPRAGHAFYLYDGCFVSAQLDAWPVDGPTIGEVLGILHALADDAPSLAAQLVAAGATKLARQS